MSSSNFAKDQLKSLIERVERLEEEKQAISTDITQVYTEAKGHGFDTKVMRHIVKIRKKSADERKEQEAICDLYMSALGMIPEETV